MDFHSQTHRLVELLGEKSQTLVLAESCTGGLIAASMTSVPGVSAWLAGSFVVYQDASKMRWLGVAEETIKTHTAVSAPVAHQMVAGALKSTPQADLAAAVTGHLGPGAPDGFDGVVYIGIGRRGQPPRTWRIDLEAKKRVGRQQEAAQTVIATLIRVLESL